MNDIFWQHLRLFILVFFEDILVYSSTWELNLQHLRLVFGILQQHQLFVKQSKCAFGQQQVEYLGHVVSHDGAVADPSRLQVIAAWPIANTIKELRGFLGLTGYYRKFIPNFSKISSPLTILTINCILHNF